LKQIEIQVAVIYMRSGLCVASDDMNRCKSLSSDIKIAVDREKHLQIELTAIVVTDMTKNLILNNR
jgi:hypothetical protein